MLLYVSYGRVEFRLFTLFYYGTLPIFLTSLNMLQANLFFLVNIPNPDQV